MRFADLDAVTLDAYGTLLRLIDPVPELARRLRERGVERADEQVRAAFAAEMDYYQPHSIEGRDREALAGLRRDCTSVFLDAIEANLAPEDFAPHFVAALRFELVPGATEAIARLRGRGLTLAVVANWDCALRDHLRALGLDAFASVVTSAEASVAKPEPAIFRLALERIGVPPGRALHVGDQPYDEQGALAAGMRFARAPLARAFEGWT